MTMTTTTNNNNVSSTTLLNQSNTVPTTPTATVTHPTHYNQSINQSTIAGQYETMLHDNVNINNHITNKQNVKHHTNTVGSHMIHSNKPSHILHQQPHTSDISNYDIHGHRHNSSDNNTRHSKTALTHIQHNEKRLKQLFDKYITQQQRIQRDNIVYKIRHQQDMIDS